MSVQAIPTTLTNAKGTIFAGGIALVAGAIAFLGVFSYLAVRFHYPEVLDGRADDVLPALLATGATGRAAWALYSVLPLIFIPAGLGAFHALRERAAGPMGAGVLSLFGGLQHDVGADALAERALGAGKGLAGSSNGRPFGAGCDLRWVESLPRQLYR